MRRIRRSRGRDPAGPVVSSSARLISSSGNSVRGNTVSSASAGVGIWADPSSPYDNVAQNTVSSLGKGIVIESADNVIDWDLASGCGAGGTYNDGTQVADRDAGIVAAANECP